MNSLREQVLVLFTTPFYVIIIGLEIILSNIRKQDRKVYSLKDTIANLYLMLINGTIDLLFRTVYVGILVYCCRYRIYEFINPVSYWIVLVVAEDFLYYWLHRFDHSVRLFWAIHVTHHSSNYMNFAVGFRSSVFQPLYRFVYFIPLVVCGFRPLDILFVYSATQIWGIFVHTELVGTLGWLEYFFVTPSHHRVHHASNPKYLDRNMGMFLIIWDKIFGTFQPELKQDEYQPIRYGLSKEPALQTPVSLIFHEWTDMIKDLRRRELSWKQRLGYLFGPPGWSHDSSRLTSEGLRRLEQQKESVNANDRSDTAVLEPGEPTGGRFNTKPGFRP